MPVNAVILFRQCSNARTICRVYQRPFGMWNSMYSIPKGRFFEASDCTSFWWAGRPQGLFLCKSGLAYSNAPTCSPLRTPWSPGASRRLMSEANHWSAFFDSLDHPGGFWKTSVLLRKSLPSSIIIGTTGSQMISGYQNEATRNRTAGFPCFYLFTRLLFWARILTTHCLPLPGPLHAPVPLDTDGALQRCPDLRLWRPGTLRADRLALLAGGKVKLEVA